MRSIKNKLIFALACCACLSLSAVSAYAEDYEYEGDKPGDTFYEATSLETDYVANSDDIVVGADGTIGTDVLGGVSSGPISGVSMPVGEYPDAWGSAVDLAIAQNSVFVNELGPTTQTTAIYTPTYVVGAVASGALPTGYATATSAPRGTMVPVSGSLYGVWTAESADVSVAAPSFIRGGNYFGMAVSAAQLPKLTSGGAIAKLSIPSINLSKYVYEGTTSSSLNRGIGHFECTPAMGGNVSLAGHNRGNGVAHFARLKDVKVGDVVTYETAYGVSTYVVSSIETVSVNDVSGLMQDGTGKLTMYTCKANQPSVKLKVVATQVA